MSSPCVISQPCDLKMLNVKLVTVSLRSDGNTKASCFSFLMLQPLQSILEDMSRGYVSGEAHPGMEFGVWSQDASREEWFTPEALLWFERGAYPQKSIVTW